MGTIAAWYRSASTHRPARTRRKWLSGGQRWLGAGRRVSPMNCCCSSVWARTTPMGRYALTSTSGLTTGRLTLNAWFSWVPRGSVPAGAGSYFVTRPDWCSAPRATLPTHRRFGAASAFGRLLQRSRLIGFGTLVSIRRAELVDAIAFDRF